MDIKKRLSKTVRAHDPPRVVKPSTDPTGPIQSMWKTLWKKLKKEKKKFMVRSTSMHVHHVGYDEYTYMQNFDQGLQWNSESEPDVLSRSFSVRYTNRRSAIV
ncbi:hypothetical protein L1987_40946 [Smallanthus sonchifolius]|uniref:Uncharacterized protein n=1 Tax=Smallanthus sonchifolius TaxID=185202 RepID=A0ACB9GVA5_9ASTR|nr:hypothetical protein L1987_40946 [Smallanthus sonchifolius]